MALLFVASIFGADFEIVDPAEFQKLFPKNAKVEKLATDMQFIEGPVWVNAEGGYLVFSDIPANELKRWDSKKGVEHIPQAKQLHERKHA